MTIELGRLQSVDARDVWANEATHFTPWLAEEHNLALLGEAIGIELELEATEKSVGPFSADILCKDTNTETLVLIENQLEKTDHTHLGQLLTYASGLKAVTIVWIANPFREEHRSALDWLNDITGDEFKFFGLEVELWRIGDSSIAPKFNVISKPNNWSKSVSEGVVRVEGELTESKKLQLEFWTEFRDFAESSAKTIKITKPRPQHWMNMSIGRSGFNLTAIASLWNNETQSYSPNEIRAQVEIHQNQNAKIFFERLREQQEQIEFELGFPVTWFNDPNKISCKIVTSKSVDLSDRSDWNNQFAWLVKQLDGLHRVFWHRIRDL